MIEPLNIAEAEARLAAIAKYLPLAVDADPYTGRSDVYRPEKIATDGGPILADIPHDLAVFIAHAPTDLAAALAELRALREILAGRTTPPTDAEIMAHAATDGARWKGAIDGDVVYLEKRPSAAVRAQTGLRWWAVDGADNPCAWPVVTP